MTTDTMKTLISKLTTARIVLDNLPPHPGYSGSILLLDDTEAARIVKDLDEAIAALDSQAAQAQPNGECEWREDDPWGPMPGTYESACGEAWSFIEGGAKENGVKFCHNCGKPVKVIPYPAASDDEESASPSPNDPPSEGVNAHTKPAVSMQVGGDVYSRLRQALEHCAQWLPADCAAAIEAREVLATAGVPQRVAGAEQQSNGGGA